MKWNIGDKVIDEDGNQGIVCIKWNDGDICTYENDAAHPNPEKFLECEQCNLGFDHFSYDDHEYVISECLNENRPLDNYFNKYRGVPGWCPLKAKIND